MRFGLNCLIPLILSGLLASSAHGALSGEDKSVFASAIQHFKDGDHEKSLQLLTTLSKKHPSDALVIFNLGNSLFMSGRHREALASFEKVVRLGSPLAPAARLYSAKTLRKLGRAKEATSILQSLAKEPLAPALKAAVLADLNTPSESALDLYRQQRFEDALQAIESGSGGGTPAESRLLKAMILIRVDRPSEARTILKQLSRSAPTSDVRRTSRDLLNTLEDRGYGIGSSWLFLETSFGITQNPYYEPESSDPETKGLARLIIGGGHRFMPDGPITVSPSYAATIDEVIGEKELRIFDHFLQVPVAYENEGRHFSIAPLFNHQSWAELPALQKIGARARAQLDHNSWLYGADLELSNQQALDSAIDYLEGDLLHARAFAGASLYPFYVQLTYDWGRERVGDIVDTGFLLPIANTYHGPGARVLWRMNREWTLSMRTLWIRKDFDRASEPGSRKREDRVLSFEARATYRIAAGLYAYADFHSRRNDSTLGANDADDKNYDARTFLLGVSYDLL